MTFLTAMGYYGYGYPRYGFGFYWDPTLILVVIGALISMWASGRVQSTFNRYSRVGSRSGMTGAETARRILDSQGLYDVQIRSVRGNLTDHYDPRTRTVNLSQSVYGSTSVASVGVAAHECGHAVQHAQQYAPLNIRSALVPIANIGTNLSWPIIIIGLLLGMSPFLRHLGILLFSLGVLFQLVTSAGGVQRLQPGGDSAGSSGNSAGRGSGRRQKGAEGGCSHLCGGSGGNHSAAAENGHPVWRKKQS